ncbi:MAG: DUF1573 domain-containing protein [Bacteroidetes bacterium]|nr:DUF1573 domain-containing protein [Bacteroidota bacterium]
MKKSISLIAVIAMFATTAIAQTTPQTSRAASPAQVTNQSAETTLKFKEEEHNFGTIPEGPSVSYDFEFKNTGKEPIVLSNVQASCGCTTPTWPKEPIAPGQSSKITATYSTQGRPGQINKTITVTSNVGTKVLKITGMVEKAPDSSVPSNNNSMMKH